MQSVLVLESNADTAEMYAVGLDLAGFQPIVAADVDDAMAHLQRETPNALVAEAHDDGGGVWSLIRTLKTQPATRNVPVIVLTTRTDRTIPQRIDELGCEALLVKPCLPETLSAVLRCLLLEPRITADLSRDADPGDCFQRDADLLS
jgi:two-component system, OmpR family, phosphate regulon response regulator PhoB